MKKIKLTEGQLERVILRLSEQTEGCDLTFEQLVEKFKSHMGGYTPWDLEEIDNGWQIKSDAGCSSDFELVGVKVDLSSGNYQVMFDKVEDVDGIQYIRFEPVRTPRGPKPQVPFSLKQKRSVVKEQISLDNLQGKFPQWSPENFKQGVRNITTYWADKLGYDSDDIDVSVEGIKNIPSWWNDELTKVVATKVKEKGDKVDPEKLVDDMYNTMKSVYNKLPSRSEVTNVIKSVFCPFC